MAKYLDSTGLSILWGKIKSWVLNSIASGVNTVKVGKITDGARLDFSTDSVTMTERHSNTDTVSAVITKNGVKCTGSDNNHVLLGGGSTKVIGGANGLATLDSNGKVPLAQLGNLDTTVAEVVTALPTSNIKKHLYLIRASSTTTNNIYKEYLYIGDPSATYDASKWEEMGEFKANIDLSPYAKVVDLTSHTNNKSNPHQVTKAQVGLGNVDNTSDANKPVSTAQQTALNGKVDKVSGKGLSTNDYTTDDKNKVADVYNILRGDGFLGKNNRILFDSGPEDLITCRFSLEGMDLRNLYPDGGYMGTQYRQRMIVFDEVSSNSHIQKIVRLPDISGNAATILTNEDVEAIPDSVINALA